MENSHIEITNFNKLTLTLEGLSRSHNNTILDIDKGMLRVIFTSSTPIICDQNVSVFIKGESLVYFEYLLASNSKTTTLKIVNTYLSHGDAFSKIIHLEVGFKLNPQLEQLLMNRFNKDLLSKTVKK